MAEYVGTGTGASGGGSLGKGQTAKGTYREEERVGLASSSQSSSSVRRFDGSTAAAPLVEQQLLVLQQEERDPHPRVGRSQCANRGDEGDCISLRPISLFSLLLMRFLPFHGTIIRKPFPPSVCRPQQLVGSAGLLASSGPLCRNCPTTKCRGCSAQTTVVRILRGRSLQPLATAPTEAGTVTVPVGMRAGGLQQPNQHILQSLLLLLSYLAAALHFPCSSGSMSLCGVAPVGSMCGAVAAAAPARTGTVITRSSFSFHRSHVPLTAASASCIVQLPFVPSLKEDPQTKIISVSIPSSSVVATCPVSHPGGTALPLPLGVAHQRPQPNCMAKSSIVVPTASFLSSISVPEAGKIVPEKSEAPFPTVSTPLLSGGRASVGYSTSILTAAESVGSHQLSYNSTSVVPVNVPPRKVASTIAPFTKSRNPSLLGRARTSCSRIRRVTAARQTGRNVLGVLGPIRSITTAATAQTYSPSSAARGAFVSLDYPDFPHTSSNLQREFTKRLLYIRGGLPLLRTHGIGREDRRQERVRTIAATQPVQTATKAAGVAATTNYSNTSLFSSSAPSPLWFLSALSRLWWASSSSHTQREDNQHFHPSSTAATASIITGSTSSDIRSNVRSVPTVSSPSGEVPVGTAVPCPRRSYSTGAGSGATYPPVCVGCSSILPSITMAAAAGTDSAGTAGTGAAQMDAQPSGHPPVAKHPIAKHRLDYKPPDFLIDMVDLVFDLHDEKTKVTSTLTIRRRPEAPAGDLVLDGEDLQLHRVTLDGEELTDGSRGSRKGVRSAEAEDSHEQQQKHQAVASHRVYTLNDQGKLVIPQDILPQGSDTKFLLTTEVQINPTANLQLMGLYKTGRFFVTQCEAEGFRRITYFLDRPDVMALYKVKLIADKKTCPTLLSNGNQIDAGDVQGQPNKHYAVFEDPFRKPCYLFALVAGELAHLAEKFKTFRGREISVKIFSEPQDSDKLEWAMQSLLKAMRWDEERFGLEYDLDIYNVVCASDFNMGAMENKSLNVFNTAALLAHPKTSTDANYERVLSVIGHEYFHNWTGNRVTCRDWFQLTLKEGLTVFRDQLFSADMFSAAVKRIEDVRDLRARQFVEDSGPMAHPIRPETYVAIDNFYTSTVYSKGAEVIRMYHTLLGEIGFRRGMDLYFKRHDGHAVTCDDFRNAMADANNKDLTQFELWYSQAGTPLLEIVEATWLGPQEKAYKLTVKQTIPPTPKQPTKKPMLIPIKFGLIGKESKTDLLTPATQVLELINEEQTFIIAGVGEDCVLSFLRDFSAPVKVKYPAQTEEEIAFLMGFDSDGFSKWEAAHTLASKIVSARAVLKRDHPETEEYPPLPQIYVDAFKATLLDTDGDRSIQAYALRLPDLEGLAQDMDPTDPDALYAAAESVRKEINHLLHDDLLKVYEANAPPATDTEETRDQQAVARRRLRKVLLYFLTGDKDEAAAKFAMKHFKEAKGMTDRFAAVGVLVDIQQPEKQEALDIFYKAAEGNPLVLNKWFALQAMAETPDTIESVRQLQNHPDFIWTNPNRLRALMFSFAHSTQFHNTNGKGYSLIADCVLKVDKFNPQVAAHCAGFFLQWRRYDEKRQQLMLEQLRRIRDTPGLSPDTKEIVDKALTDDPALTRSRKSERSGDAEKEVQKSQAHDKQE